MGVGIDYCIHVTERYREEKEKGKNHQQALHGVGGACALALVGSAVSDVAGFAIIATSSMGLFNTFGLFSANHDRIVINRIFGNYYSSIRVHASRFQHE